ncbi:MAG: PrgI family protein [Candidatus Paceibacterota bacterium]
MEYQVPQFIEVEDKIFGPLTLKQFIYLAGGIGLCVVFVLYLPLVVAIILCIPVGGFAGALAFYKVNNKSFTDMLGAGLSFYTKDRLYLWKKEEKSEQARPVVPVAPLPPREKLGISSGRLKDLALSLDIKDQNSPQEPI